MFLFEKDGKALWGCADWTVRPNTLGVVYFTYLSGQSYLSPGARSITSQQQARPWQLRQAANRAMSWKHAPCHLIWSTIFFSTSFFFVLSICLFWKCVVCTWGRHLCWKCLCTLSCCLFISTVSWFSVIGQVRQADDRTMTLAVLQRSSFNTGLKQRGRTSGILNVGSVTWCNPDSYIISPEGLKCMSKFMRK